MVKKTALTNFRQSVLLFSHFGNEVLEILFCSHVKKGLLSEHFNKSNSYVICWIVCKK